MKKHGLLWLLSVALGGCSLATPDIVGCTAGNGLEPDCRYENPEDIAPTPSGRFVLISEMGWNSTEGRRGRLSALRLPNTLSGLTRTNELQKIDLSDFVLDRREGWGVASCLPPQPANWVPHGIDLEYRSDQALALYVVAHGAREAIDMFELTETESRPTLIWRGCVEAPPEGSFNDVVILRSGGFWVSQTFPRGASLIPAGLRMQFLGYEPGFAYAWSAERGFESIAGSEVGYGNGIEKSDDERYLFLNGYFSNRTIKVDVREGRRVGHIEVRAPDNLSWDTDGRLLIASHEGSIADQLRCLGVVAESCGMKFNIISADPERFGTRIVLGNRGAPLGAATVAVRVQGRLLLGTFAGDRIAWWQP